MRLFQAGTLAVAGAFLILMRNVFARHLFSVARKEDRFRRHERSILRGTAALSALGGSIFIVFGVLVALDVLRIA